MKIMNDIIIRIILPSAFHEGSFGAHYKIVTFHTEVLSEHVMQLNYTL